MRHNTTKLMVVVAGALALAAFGLGCSSNAEQAKAPAQECRTSDKVGGSVGESLDLAARDTAKGVETFGASTVEFFKHGSSAAAKKWDEKAHETAEVSRKHAGDVRDAAHCR